MNGDRGRRTLSRRNQPSNGLEVLGLSDAAHLGATETRARDDDSFGRARPQLSIQAVETFEMDQPDTRATFQNALLTFDDSISLELPPGGRELEDFLHLDFVA